MSHKYLLRALVLLSMAGASLLASPQITSAQFATPTPTASGPTPTPLPLSAREHADELLKAESQLRAVEGASRRSLKPLQPLENPRLVTRPNGDKIQVGGDEWKQRREDAASHDERGKPLTVSRPQVLEARQAVQERREALQEWAFPPGGKYFQADASARDAVVGWQKQKLIETGPSALQQQWLAFVRWVYGLLDSASKWLNSLLSRSPRSQPMHVDTKKAELFFYLILAAILAGAAWLTWRALGGRVRRGLRTAHHSLLEGEDAALLRLPPDELLDRAAQFAREGNFREALRHRYLSLLLLLDARGVWRYDRRRTNWEHIARLKGAQAPREGVDALSNLTLHFDRVRYGNQSCEQNAWLLFDSDANTTLDLLSRGLNTRAHEAASSGARG